MKPFIVGALVSILPDICAKYPDIATLWFSIPCAVIIVGMYKYKKGESL